MFILNRLYIKPFYKQAVLTGSLLFGITTLLWGQNSYRAVHWDYDDGLPTQAFFSDVYQSPEGYLWFSTSSGVVRFDGINFELLNEANSRITANSILTFFKDSDKRWWYGIEGKGFGAFTKDTTIHFSDPSYAQKYAEIPEGTLWLGTDGNGLWKINLQADTLAPRQVFEEVGVYIYDLSAGTSNKLHVASERGLFTIRNDSIVNYQIAKDVLSVWTDSTDNIWYGTDEGLNQYQNGNTRLIDFPSEPRRPLIHQVTGYQEGVLALSDHALYLYQNEKLKPIFETNNMVLVSLKTDHEGNIWLGTEANGLIQLIPTTIRMLKKEDGLSGEVTTVITQSNDGTIYIGTTSGLAILDKESSNIRTLFEGSMVTSVLADSENRIWVALRGQGIRLLKENRVHSFTAQNGLLSTAVWTLYEDSNGKIWAGGAAGVSTYNPENGWVANSTVQNKLLNRDVRVIKQSHSGNLWIGTSYGLHAFTDDTVRVYATEHGLKSALILDIAESREGVLWIATKDAGLHRMKDGKIEHLPESLTGSKISRIIPVGSYLWLAGSNTIIGIDSDALEEWLDHAGELPNPIRFGDKSGLAGEMLGTIQPNGWQMKNGELWFAASRGAAILEPEAQNLQLPPPPITLNYTIVGTDTLQKPAAIEIPHSRDRVEISYTGFSFTNPEEVSYSYRLNGFDQQWNKVGNRRTAIYTNLPPGNYVFEVKAQIDDGPYSRQSASVPVTVIPAFYETLWFRATVVIVILLIFWGLYSYRINSLKRLERLKVRIANDLHDEIGSNLGSIVLRSRLLSQNESFTDKQQQNLTEISRISRQTAVSMRDIIWLINPEKDRLNDLQHKLKQIAQQLLVDISFDFNTEGEKLQQEIPLKIRRNTVFIYREILHNIIKHSEASSVEICLKNHQQEINLLVKDDGKGFDENGSKNDGIGLESMQRRADDIQAQLSIISSPGRGTKVNITIPIT